MRTKMLMAVACLGAAIGSAQTMNSTVTVNFAHDTQVGKVSLPAGTYSIKEVTNSVIQISSDSRNGVSTFAIVSPVSTPSGAGADRTKVILKEADNGTYEMKSIWLEGQDFGYELE